MSTTLRDATGILAEVRTLLVELEDELKLLHEVPALTEQIREIHAIVTAGAKP